MPVLDINNNEEVNRYKEYLESSPYTRLTQALEWGEVKSNWKKEVVYLEEDGKIIASMFILITQIPIKKKTFLYAPRGPVCNPYDVELVKRLVDEASKVAKEHNAYLLKFDPAVRYDEKLDKLYSSNGFKTRGKNPKADDVIQPSYDAILNIENVTEEELIKRFSEKTRYNIRLSKRKGVEVYYSRKEEDLKTFYELYKITCERDKIGCREYKYFENMLNAYDEDHLRIYIAKHEDDKLSAAIAINYGPEMFYLYGASSNVKRNLMPNYAMQWEMIRWGLEKGSKIYNFGGIVHLDKNNGLYKFKTGFCREEGIFKYIGEIDYVYDKGVYFLYKHFLPVIKKIKRVIRETKRKLKK